MGGAMDLVVGARKVIIATTHTNNGDRRSSEMRPAADAYRQVDLIVTELAVIAVEPDGLACLKSIPTIRSRKSYPLPKLI